MRRAMLLTTGVVDLREATPYRKVTLLQKPVAVSLLS